MKLEQAIYKIAEQMNVPTDAILIAANAKEEMKIGSKGRTVIIYESDGDWDCYYKAINKGKRDTTIAIFEKRVNWRTDELKNKVTVYGPKQSVIAEVEFEGKDWPE